MNAPPQRIVEPDLMSLTASSADFHTFDVFGIGAVATPLEIAMTDTRSNRVAGCLLKDRAAMVAASIMDFGGGSLERRS